ncbi:hypothetical protein [Pandoraea communis]|nr:hypothetical protein [Pandoraea communis]MDM8354773.1 hypothetical protein [Pandoraea communis]
MNFDEIFFLIEIILKAGVKVTARDRGLRCALSAGDRCAGFETGRLAA